MESRHRLLVHGARQVVQVVANGQQVLKGAAMRQLAEVTAGPAGGVSIVVNSNGRIADIGLDSVVTSKYGGATFDRTINARGMCVLPGLVDGHTHPVWAGDRVHEFAMKLAGATYMEVHEAGGGINFTVRHTREASEEELYTSLCARLNTMIKSGTTLVECKSGYGLNVETELKMLRVIERARRDMPIDISATFCGAHSVPEGATAAQATDDVIDVQLPAVGRLMDSGQLRVDNIDVFCERGVFDVAQTQRILAAGAAVGLAANFHGEELSRLGSAEMGATLGARAISHLEEVSDDGVAAMARQGTIAVVLPTTAYVLGLRPPPVRAMIAADVAVALGSDFNPNAHCVSMPLVMNLACVLLKMCMQEALAAATINAAASLGRADTQGSLEVGKYGDLVLIEADSWEHLIYQMGGHENLIKYTVKEGVVIHEARECVSSMNAGVVAETSWI
ncbi:PREDICTED: probable imidazolonepropionase [Priapulus caudatus]|uniref:imidazolonepropionase n=1 Tax=Priapulus caudatus TaxID=37621 RepID=A0ABM1EQ60_PRICU|nr:PREDICTED: probable imidazolonepropionase [Priapulus caudatus]